MHLPHGYRHGVCGYYWLSGSEFYLCKPLHVVIFVDLAGKSWMNFLAAAMAEAKRQGFDMIKKKLSTPSGSGASMGALALSLIGLLPVAF